MKTTKKSLISSAVALLLCFAMLLGTTYAWFTDSATSAGNTIQAGNLKIDLLHKYEGNWVSLKQNPDHKVFDYDKWEPGYTRVESLKIDNLGNLALQYRLSLEVEYGSATLGKNGENLADVIEVYLTNGENNETSYAAIKAAWSYKGTLSEVMKNPSTFFGGELLPTGEELVGNAAATTAVASKTVSVALHMKESAGNEYQKLDVGNIYVNLIATQWSYENDSFNSEYDKDTVFPEINIGGITVDVTTENNVVTQAATVSGTGVTATVPAGVAVESGVNKLGLSVTEKTESDANITVGDGEALRSLDVHMAGVAKNNTVPMLITIEKAMKVGLNIGNYTLYHVENGQSNAMTAVNSLSDLNTHNEFYYDPATGDVTLAMATFSEVAMLAETAGAWEGNFDDSWYNADATELSIANADQLAAFGAIVGGMKFTVNETEKQYEADSFVGKTVKLLADINLGDKESENKSDLIFYPIGYYNSTGSYEKTAGGSVTSSVSSFEGTFDGNGNTISNFYQNTWEMFGDYNDGYSGTPNHYKDAMGLFGYVLNGTVKNLTVSNFSSDGEFTPTGVIAAYADGDSTFENIAIINCNPRVYNTGNGGIIGIAGDTSAANDDHINLKNITVDNSNKISALWGSWDVACGGLVGMYRGNVDGNGNATGDTISFENCHVAAQIDVYNDVCANYQYYAYRYSGMIIGSVRHNTKNNEGKTVPNMTGISATGCTVNYGDWNDYYYCEFEKNTIASYSPDYQFSRVPHSELNFTDSNGNGVVDADERASVTGCKHTHTAEENHQAIYLPFHQLFTGYSWGVSSIGLEKYSGIVTNLDITEGDQEESVVKFETKFTGDFLYRVGNENAVSLGSLFAAKDGVTISDAGVWVKVEKLDENMNVSGTFTANTSDWTKGTIKFSGTGVVKITIQDYNFCTPTTLIVEVVDAVNATGATNATANNVVLLNNIESGFTVSGRYAVYGNGFTLTCSGTGSYLNNGLKQGFVTVNENGTIDNLRIIAPIYPAACLYYGATTLGDASQNYKNDILSTDSKSYYDYQLSAVALSGNGTVSNCYIYGGRNNIFVNTGDVTIKDTILECGVVANIQIQSNASHTITLENVTTIQYQVNPTVGDTSKVMLGAGVLVGPETTENPKIVLNGDFKQYNWVNADDQSKVTNTVAQAIIEGALNATAYNHTVNGKTASNLGIIYMNTNAAEVTNNTEMPYVMGDVSIKVSGTTINGKVCSLQGATEEQIYSDYANADKSTVNGYYTPQFSYSPDLGGQYVAEGGDEHCYREGDTIYVMFPISDAVTTLDISKLVDIQKYSGQDLNLQCFCTNPMGMMVPAPQGKLDISNAGNYTLRYEVTDTLFYNENGETVEKTVKYTWDVTVSVSLKDVSVPNAEFEFDSSKQTMGYAKKNFLSGGNTQYLPFLAGLKIYDYNYGSETPYLRFDGDTDFNKIASAEITGYTSANHVLIKVTLTDGGVINIDTTARAVSGGSTYTGNLQTSGSTLYYVNGGTTSATTTTWVISNYSFIGNNGVTVDSGSVNFANCENGSVPGSSFSTTINYTVSYDAKNGKCGQAVSYATSVSSAVTLPTPTRSGYIFLGWYTAASGGTKVGGAGDSYTPSANITLYAQWILPFDVIYNANGGSCDTTSARYDGTALTLPDATRDGYWFIGWYDAATGGNKIGDAGASYHPTSEITLYAHWQEQISYTVTYNASANGGTCGTDSATYEGIALTLPTPENRTGYTFKGWYDAATGGNKIGDAGATYSPSADITLYAQWTVNSYTIKVTTSNATVKVNGTSVSNNGTVSVPYGTSVTVEVTYSQNNSKSTTIKGNDGTTYGSPFDMPAQEVTINATSSGTCVTPDTLVTLADGTQKEIQYVTYEDQLLVWNFYTGEYDIAPASIAMNHGAGTVNVTTLNFSDGTTIKTINGHGFFDVATNEFVLIDEFNASDYIGHNFVKQDGNGYNTVELVSYSVEEQYTEVWSLLTAEHYNCVLEGMWTVTAAEVDNSPEWLMPYAIGEDMKYDEAAMRADIEKYGLYTYEDFADYMTYEQFVALGLENFKVSVGKEFITWNDILYLISIHIG